MSFYKITRFYDIFLSIAILIFFSPILVTILLICFFESQKPIFIQKRVGKNQKPFNLLKFRTMQVNTPSLASHLVKKGSVTKFGKIIRSLKLDELPQLINVIKGEMSLVGPRPCLYNQKKLISLREKSNIFFVKPGITGLAQIKGIDMSTPNRLTNTDLYMISNYSQKIYFKYLFLTLFGRGIGDKIKK
ncbi:sugar transferase [Prochlorococcus sp. AH-716-P08]|nr:sugar transferase [Prochlorococcus sp. AH-716-P08]